MKEFEIFKQEFNNLTLDVKINIYNNYIGYYGGDYIWNISNKSVNYYIVSKIKDIFNHESCWSEYIDPEIVYDKALFVDKEYLEPNWILDSNIDKFHFIDYKEYDLCDEYEKFQDSFFKLPLRAKLNICYKFAMKNNLDIIWRNNVEDIEKIKAIHHISDEKIKLVCHPHYSDKWLFKDKYSKKLHYNGYDYNDDEFLFNNIFDIFANNKETLFKNIDIWGNYMHIYSVFNYNENYECAFSKMCFKIDYLREYLFSAGTNYNDFDLYIKEFHKRVMIESEYFDCDLISRIIIFYKLRKRCPWANINILKWYILNVSDKNGYVPESDIYEDFIYNYKTIKEKFYKTK